MSVIALLASVLLAAPWAAPGAGRVEVSGVVLDHGAPVAHARISLLAEKGGLLSIWRVAIPAVGGAETDAQGRFSLRAAPGRYAVVACRAGEDLHIRVAPVTIGAKGARVTVVFDGKTTISGRTLGWNGKPLERVRVTAYPYWQEPGALTGDATIARAWSRADGTFTLAGLRAGRYRLVALGNHHADLSEEGVLAESGSVDVEIPLKSAPVVRGRVVRGGAAPPGTPVATFGVSSVAFGARGFEAEDGIFEVALKNPWKGLPLLISAPGLAVHAMKVDLAPGEERDLGDVSLTVGRPLRGRVLDTAGQPIAGATIRIGFRNHALNPPIGTSGEDGTFELPRIDEGDTSILVERPGLRATEVLIRAATDDAEIRMAPGGSVHVRVEDLDGSPVAGRQVQLVNGLGCWTAEEGDCTISGLMGERILGLSAERDREAPRAPQLRAFVAEGQTVEVRFRVPQQPSRLDVQVRAPPGISASGRVALVPGEVGPGLLLGPDLSGLPPFHDGRSRSLRNLPPGRYTAFAVDAATPSRCARKVVDVVEGTNEPLELVLPATPGPCP